MQSPIRRISSALSLFIPYLPTSAERLTSIAMSTAADADADAEVHSSEDKPTLAGEEALSNKEVSDEEGTANAIEGFQSPKEIKRNEDVSRFGNNFFNKFIEEEIVFEREEGQNGKNGDGVNSILSPDSSTSFFPLFNEFEIMEKFIPLK